MLILTVTTTFAWISLATVNMLSSIELNAISEYDLEISLDGINYSKNLKLNNFQGLKLTDVTSMDGVTFNKLTDAEVKPVENVDYYNITFYFQTTHRELTEIHLFNHQKNVSYNEERSGTLITSEGRMFKTEYTYKYSEDLTIEKGTEKIYYAKDAMRIAFNSEDLENAKIFDLSDQPTRGFGYPFGAINYYYNKEGIELVAPNGPEVVTEMSEFSEDQPRALTHTSYLTTLKFDETSEKYVGSITVSIWLEGWDADAFDAIRKDKLKIQLEFKAVMPEDYFEKGE